MPGINVLSYEWVKENYWLVPHPRLAVQCIKKIISQKCACTCTLIFPIWKLAPFWPLLANSGKTNSLVIEQYIFGRGRNGKFNSRKLGFGFIGVRFM